MACIDIIFISVTSQVSLVINVCVFFLPAAPSISMPGLGQKEGWEQSSSALRLD